MFKKIADQYGNVGRKIKVLEEKRSILKDKIKKDMVKLNTDTIKGNKYQIRAIKVLKRTVKPEVAYDVLGEKFFNVVKVSNQAFEKEVGKNRFEDLSEPGPVTENFDVTRRVK